MDEYKKLWIDCDMERKRIQKEYYEMKSERDSYKRESEQQREVIKHLKQRLNHLDTDKDYK